MWPGGCNASSEVRLKVGYCSRIRHNSCSCLTRNAMMACSSDCAGFAEAEHVHVLGVCNARESRRKPAECKLRSVSKNKSARAIVWLPPLKRFTPRWLQRYIYIYYRHDQEKIKGSIGNFFQRPPSPPPYHFRNARRIVARQRHQSSSSRPKAKFAC